QIIEETKTQIDIDDDGTISITGETAEGMERAIQWIRSLTLEPEVGQEFTGKVVRIMDFGAFVELAPGKDGLIHISELAPHRVEKVTDIVKVGDQVKVKVIKIDDQG